MVRALVQDGTLIRYVGLYHEPVKPAEELKGSTPILTIDPIPCHGHCYTLGSSYQSNHKGMFRVFLWALAGQG